MRPCEVPIAVAAEAIKAPRSPCRDTTAVIQGVIIVVLGDRSLCG